jgi:ribose 5-phosphate isomerase B
VIVIASDHAGVPLKRELIKVLEARREDYTDLGPLDERSVDYPDYAHRLVSKLVDGPAEYGVLVCGTGIGMAMTANRYPGIRAALCHDSYTTEMARRHNDANVLCLGGRVIGVAVAARALEVFLDTRFEGGRHQRRVDKIEREGR